MTDALAPPIRTPLFRKGQSDRAKAMRPTAEIWPPQGESRVFWTTFIVFGATVVAAQSAAGLVTQSASITLTSCIVSLFTASITWFALRFVVMRWRGRGLATLVWLVAVISIIGGALSALAWVGATIVDLEGLGALLPNGPELERVESVQRRLGAWQARQSMIQGSGLVAYHSMFLNLAFGTVYFLFVEHLASQEGRADVAQYEAAANLAQLKMLRFQLNPHFLFNSLSAVATLVGEKRNDDAEEMLLSLSRFLRFSLDNDVAHKVRLAEEIEAQRLYAAIESNRFGDRLETHWTIDRGLNEARVPGLVLQPLIENAVKHGVSKWISGGAVTISASRAGDTLSLEVRNVPKERRAPAPPLLSEHEGVGLKNTRERLRMMYGAKASLETRPLEDGGYSVLITLPYEDADMLDNEERG